MVQENGVQEDLRMSREEIAAKDQHIFAIEKVSCFCPYDSFVLL
jgi:hypothetical protein